ncbi:M24 family metallopeptidase [Candidatus Kaiserbacteria bacterium]|nr:M24 family metallopeptidase [Candidatus Kaiserbacteria bacterium]USN91968.1 MAG: M24 family metallopeptidase [Candidatus Nomurabacteria bacterium]
MDKNTSVGRRKSDRDLLYIKDTQKVTELAMEAVVLYLSSAEKPTSEEAHKIIDEVLKDHDCESPHGHIVAGGAQSAKPHEIGEGEIEKGVPIVIDIFPRSRTTGYFADMSRTVCIGQPSDKLQKMYHDVLSLQLLAISMIKPGVKCSEIHTAVADHFKKAGYVTSGKGEEFRFAEGFVHSVGHGVGLNIHEAPYLGSESVDVLCEGDVITIEPGLYYKEIGGVRLEDLLVVTSEGSENLTNYPKNISI